MNIAKTASRNVAFKSGKLAESVFTCQANILTRQLVTEDSSKTKAKRIFKTRVIIRICIFLYNITAIQCHGLASQKLHDLEFTPTDHSWQ